MDLTIVLVTSPAISNPDTHVIESTIESLCLLEDTQDCPVLIVMDGYTVHNKIQTKRGRITADMERNYKSYCERLLRIYRHTRFSFFQCDTHHGFALAVQRGLQLCQTTYALVMQHDRKFIRPFFGVNHILDTMREHSHIRYVGFPTVMSVKHEDVLRTSGLHELASDINTRIPLSGNCNGCSLRPLIFWYDSNHLCHVSRYLEIYSPYKSLPIGLKNVVDSIDPKAIRNMVMRKGDFIEDRFGQMQRNILVALRGQGPELVEMFEWFGSYILWHPEIDDENKSPSTSAAASVCLSDSLVVTNGITDMNQKSYVSGTELRKNRNRSCIMVSHLRGRHYLPNASVIARCNAALET